jgi:hypothetical protein
MQVTAKRPKRLRRVMGCSESPYDEFSMEHDAEELKSSTRKEDGGA